MIRNIFLVLGLVALVPAAFAEGDAVAGKAKTAVCAACHGADGNSMAPNFPKLAGQNASYLLKQMQDINTGLRAVPEMTGMLTSLSAQDMADIAAYYASQTMSVAGAKDKDLDLGKKLYLGGNHETGAAACSGCHSPTGNGQVARFPRVGGQHADYLIKQLKAFRQAAQYTDDEIKVMAGVDAGRRNDGDEKPMRDVASKMTDREIEALANYMSGLH